MHISVIGSSYVGTSIVACFADLGPEVTAIDIDEKIVRPTTTEDDTRSELLNTDRAQQILEFLGQYRYAHLEHALMEVLWHPGLRIGAATGLGIDDYNADEQYLTLADRGRHLAQEWAKKGTTRRAECPGLQGSR